MQHFTIEDLESLAKQIPSQGMLIQTLEHHPNIDFESVVLSGDGLEHDDPRVSVSSFDQ